MGQNNVVTVAAWFVAYHRSGGEGCHMARLCIDLSKNTCLTLCVVRKPETDDES